MQNQRVFRPTSVTAFPPSADKTVAEVEDELMSHILRSADRLDVVREVERRAEQHERHIVVRRGGSVVFVHVDFTDGADLGLRSWSR